MLGFIFNTTFEAGAERLLACELALRSRYRSVPLLYSRGPLRSKAKFELNTCTHDSTLRVCVFVPF